MRKERFDMTATSDIPDIEVILRGTYKGFDYIVAKLGGQHNNGYVQIPKGHPLYGKSYSDNLDCFTKDFQEEYLGKRSPMILVCRDEHSKSMDIVFDVHGGITFAGRLTAYLGVTSDWSIGFDCAHYGDAKDPDYYAKLPMGHWDLKYRDDEGSVYRTPEYVEQECKNLIDQILTKVKLSGQTNMTIPSTHMPELTDVDQNINDYNELEYNLDNIFTWGIKRGITGINGATPSSQMKKLKEEVDEIQEGLDEDDIAKVRDSIGDAYVVLQQIARLAGLPMEDCIAAAWGDIKDRQGQMRHGVFVKQDDINLIGEDALDSATSAEELRSLIALAKDSQ